MMWSENNRVFSVKWAKNGRIGQCSPVPYGTCLLSLPKCWSLSISMSRYGNLMEIDSVIPCAIDLNIYCCNRWHFHYPVLSIPMEDKHASASPSIEPHHDARKKNQAITKLEYSIHRPPGVGTEPSRMKISFNKTSSVGYTSRSTTISSVLRSQKQQQSWLPPISWLHPARSRTASVLFDDFGKPSKKITSKALNSRYLRNSKSLIRGH